MATGAPPKAKQGKAPFMAGSMIWQKKGPLPVWAWIVIGLSLLFVVTWWRRNKAAATESNEAVTGIYRDELPGNQGVPVFVVPQAPAAPVTILPPPPPPTPPVTVPEAPPGGGAPPPMQLPEFMQVPTEQNLYTWFSGQGTNFAAVDAWNPGWRDRDKSLWWKANPDGSNNKIPQLKTPLVLKVR
jgi:hypothetical protein